MTIKHSNYTVTKVVTTTASPFGDYVCDGTNDEVQIQAAIDAVETSGGDVLLKKGTYNVSSTVYVGNGRLIGESGAIINLTNTAAGWTRGGAASRKTEGCFLTKSAASAGYGLTSVAPKIENLQFVNNRDTMASSSVNMTFLFEQVSGGYLKNLKCTEGTSTAGIGHFDLYAKVQDFTIDSCIFSTLTAGTVNGNWIRNFTTGTTNKTKNLNINNCIFKHNQTDEVVAIFSDVGHLENINISNCIFECGTAINRDKIITVWTDNTSTIQGVNFNNITVKSIGTPINIIEVHDDGDSLVDNVNLNNSYLESYFNTVDNCGAVRGLHKVNNTYVSILGTTNTGGYVYAFYECKQMNNCQNVNNYTSSTGTTPHAANYCDYITNCKLQGDVIGCINVSNSYLTDGKIQDCETVSHNRIEYLNKFPTYIFQYQGTVRTYRNAHIIANCIMENTDSAAGANIMYISDADKSIIFNNNDYLGIRNDWVSATSTIIQFDNNLIADTDWTIDKNTSKYDRTTNPWTLLGNSAYGCPIGHIASCSNPTSGEVWGYMKVAHAGTASSHWASLGTRA